jgi:hypothetical protein
MTPRVISLSNPYRGVNAHLHSALQAAHLWNRIHGVFITQLMTVLNRQLLTMGYIARIEESLQIRRVNETTRPRGDVTIYDLQPSRPTMNAVASFGELVLEDLLEDIDEDHPYSSVAIYAENEPHDAVAWLEFLSPSNKGHSLDAAKYLTKRENVLRSGIVYVEIDLLHETPPTFDRLGDYTDPTQRDNGAFPYRVIAIDPRPDWRMGRVALRQFHVDEPFPDLHIPLNGEDVVTVDLGTVYTMTFESAAFGVDVDYTELPVQFESYSHADAARIVGCMIRVIAEQTATPIDTSHLSLEKALAWLQAWRKASE